MNKYYQILKKVLADGKTQKGRKGESRYLLNETVTLSPAELLDIFEGHNIARKKLRSELSLFMSGERQVEKYREAGINWWDYCGSILVNSYPTYFEKLPPLIGKINREKRSSKNYVLFLGSTGTESNQAPCLSLVQFQIEQGELVLTAYQRSSDANLGLPADIYHLSPAELLDIFEGHNIARKKLRSELSLFMSGERQVEKYREAGINWWDYCGSILVNSYPTYFEKLPPLIGKINREKRSSKNYVLFLGSTGTESNQAPCLSLVQFQIEQGELVLTAYQRSSDANLGLPADIYHLYLISRQIELPLKSITINLGNVHIYENNVTRTQELLAGNPNVKFELNV